MFDVDRRVRQVRGLQRGVVLVRAVRRTRARRVRVRRQGLPVQAPRRLRRLQDRRDLQEVRHRQDPRPRELQDQMQTRAAPARHAAEEAAPRGEETENTPLHQRAAQSPRVPRADRPPTGGDRDGCLTRK